MPLFRPVPAPPTDPANIAAPVKPLTADDLLSPEEIAEKKRRRRWFLTLPLLLLAVIGIGFGAKPALHAAKAWQARRTAAEAERLMDRRQWLEARGKVQDAIQLWQQEPATMRAAARLLGQTGNTREAVAFWKRLEAARPLSQEEERDYAQVLLANRDFTLAEIHLRKAWPAGQDGTVKDWELGLQMALGSNRYQEAVDLGRRILASQTATPRQQLKSAAILASANDSNLQRQGWDRILKLATDAESPESLEALLTLAQRAGVPPGSPAPAPPGGLALPGISELTERIEAHPLAKIQHRLLTTDLRILQDPARQEAEIQLAMERFLHNKNDAELGIFAGWLYARGKFPLVLDVLPASRADDDTGLFFHRLDALAALDRWPDIREEIQSKRVPIDPMIEQMYLARCAAQLNEPRVRDARWDAALDVAGDKLEKLLQLGAYALKNGNLEFAARVFGAAVSVAPDSREAHTALVGALEATGNTRKVRDQLAIVAQRWPQDAAVRNDSAYFDALLSENLPAALGTARELSRADPTSLPHRVTLALAELRLGHNLAAMDAFHGIDASRTVMQPRQRAVLAAAFWATNYNREAREALRTLSPEQLLPEERALVQPIIESTATESPPK